MPNYRDLPTNSVIQIGFAGIHVLLKNAGIGCALRAALLAISILSPKSAEAQEQRAQRFQQTPQVLARYPDIPIALDTPALRPGRTTFTTQGELEAYIAGLTAAPASAAHVSRLTLGGTPGGRDIPALLLTREGAATPAAVMQLGRPIVWLIGQQHGNEPAGGEAALALARALADGELTPLLDKLSVVIVPRANPDGAAADHRENAAGLDINRDHGLLSQPEIKLIHALVQQLPPAVVIDAHEFTVGRRWVEKLGGLQAVDLMLLSSTHPMTPPVVRSLAERVFQPAIEAAIARHGISSFVYHTTSSRAGERSISVGGNAPGIARNAFGLMGAVSFLLETRGVGIALDSFQRRVATHYIAASAILRTAADQADALVASVAAARHTLSDPIGDIVLSHTVAKAFAALPLIDPVTGADRIATINMLDTRVVTSSERRARPAGYVIGADRVAEIREQLSLLGASLCTFTRTWTLPVERYEIIDHAHAERRAINPERSLQVRVLADQQTFDAGSVFVLLDNANATRIQLALEPDAPGSLSAQLLDLGSGTLPLARFASAQKSVATDAISAGALNCPPRATTTVTNRN